MHLVEIFTKKIEDVVLQIYVALWVSGRLFLLAAIIYLLFSMGVKLCLAHKGRTESERARERERVF
jgi:hypothetical protein